MKILLIITGLGIGGAETQLCDLADNFLFEESNEIIIISLSKNKILKKPKNKKIKIVSLNIEKTPISFLIGFIKAIKLVKKFKPDIIHSHMYHANIFSRFLRIFCKIPVLISTAHSSDEGGKLRMFLYRITDRLASISTNVSQEAVESFIEKNATTKNRMIAIYNGIDTNKFHYSKQVREKIRNQLGFSDNDIILLSVGRLTKAKDYPNLFHAFSALPNRENIYLLIIGTGEEENNLKNLANHLNITKNIVWIGLKHNVQDWLSACDIFILSSQWEGFGLVVAEAMATERVVIGTDCGGIKEVIGNYGFIIPKKDSTALKNSINKVLQLTDRERANLGFNARNHIENNFSLNMISKQWLSLYSKLHDKKR